MMELWGRDIPIKEVDLEITTPKPVHFNLEIRRRYAFHPEEFVIELRRFLDIVSVDAYMVQLGLDHTCRDTCL
jgi:hypothetical protein